MALQEFEVVLYFSKEEDEDEIDRLKNLGLYNKSAEDEGEQTIAKYSFDTSDIADVLQTFVTYKEKRMDAVKCIYNKNGEILETPPLLISYQKFKELVPHLWKQ